MYIIENGEVFSAKRTESYVGFRLPLKEVYEKDMVLSKIAHTFENGLTVICYPNELTNIADKLGVRLNGYYKSNTKGLIKIESMNPEHRKRAAMKLIRESELKNKDLILELYGN